MTIPESTQKFFDSKKKLEEEYAISLLETLTEIAEVAWTQGIEIVSVRLKQNKVEMGREGLLYGADSMIIDPPQVDVISTPFMDIKIVK